MRRHKQIAKFAPPSFPKLFICVSVVASSHFFLPLASQGGVLWDAGDNTQWWFDSVNWTNNVVPPSNGASPPGVTDTDITISTTALPGGEGIVYDPANDPNFANAATQTYPAGFGPQIIQQLYVARAQNGTKVDGVPTGDGLITIKGDLTATGNVIIGRSSNVRDVATNGTIVQKGGTFLASLGSMDLAQTETTQNGYGNGTYDYRAGTLDVSRDGGSGLRLSNGTSSAALDGQPAGAGGIAKLIVHNPANHQGYVRAFNLVFNAFAGVGDGVATSADPNGVTKGVSTAEFHYENGGVRPIQVTQTLTINNGPDQPNASPSVSTMGVRSARLDLKLDSAPVVTAGVPENLGLIDVDWSATDGITGSVTGTGDLNGDGIYNNDRVFANANAPNPLASSAGYYQDSIVSAIFGGTKYNWKISYTGTITWSDVNNSVVSSVSHDGGLDVVLMGFSTESAGVAGDYNNDGKVDAADYVTWRKNPGSFGGDPAGYTTWRTNFGLPGAGSGLGTAAVPEPCSLMLLIGGVATSIFVRRKRAC